MVLAGAVEFTMANTLQLVVGSVLVHWTTSA